MGLDRLLAEEELRRDLTVRLVIANELGDLELPLGESFDSIPLRAGRPAPPVVPLAEPAQLALGLVAI